MNSTESAGPLAFFQGRFLPAAAVAIPYWDLAFTSGAAVSEHLRTCGQRPAFWDRHLRRFARGLAALKIDLPDEFQQLRAIVDRLVRENLATESADAELGICCVASPGSLERWAPVATQPGGAAKPWLLAHTYPLPTYAEAQADDSVVRLRSAGWLDVPAACMPKDFKHRSRLNYFLAERTVADEHPGAEPLLLNDRGDVIESSRAAIAMWDGSGWVVPPVADVFASICLDVIQEIGAAESIPVVRRSISLPELTTAAEVIWGNVPWGLRPVVAVDGRAIGTGVAGPQYQRLRDLYLRAAIRSTETM